jgi:hypothetical protein
VDGDPDVRCRPPQADPDPVTYDVWEIEPEVGAGPVRFGMTRASLRERLGSFSAFRRGSTPDLTDQYAAGLLMLTCSDDEGLYLIEVADPWTVSFRGVRLGGAAAEVVAALQTAGAEVRQSLLDAGHAVAGEHPDHAPVAGQRGRPVRGRRLTEVHRG